MLDQALLAFWRHGYAATSISSLRQVTGLGAKSLYDTFGGKRDMFLACLERYGETVLPMVFDQSDSRYAPLETLHRILETLVRVSPRGPARGCLLGVAAAAVENDPELSAAIRAYLDKIQASLAELLRSIPLKDNAPPPAELASMLMTLLQGMHLISRVDGTRDHARVAVKTAMRLVEEQVA